MIHCHVGNEAPWAMLVVWWPRGLRSSSVGLARVRSVCGGGGVLSRFRPVRSQWSVVALMGDLSHLKMS